MLRTPLCDLLEIEHPIINAPMAGSAGGTLAAAVSEAGGFGLIGGTSRGGVDWLREQIRLARRLTSRPFGVGLITSFPGTDELMQVLLEERVAAVCHSFADPTPYVGPAHAAGMKVIAQVQTMALAQTAVAAGADLIAAQGTEAGGHTGYAGAMALIPAVVDVAGNVPVIAAGGIADGRGLAAALLLGAAGAWLGTRFVASQEWEGGDWARTAVIGASTDDTVLTQAYDRTMESPFPGWIGDRVLRNEFTDTWHTRTDDIPANRAELAQTVGHALAQGDPRLAPVRAGNAAGLIHAVEPAGEILRRVVAEAERLLRARPGEVLQ